MKDRGKSDRKRKQTLGIIYTFRLSVGVKPQVQFLMNLPFKAHDECNLYYNTDVKIFMSKVCLLSLILMIFLLRQTAMNK